MNFAAYIKILRPLNLIITFFSVIIAAVISASFSELDLNTLFIALSVTFSFAGGNVINDIIDYEIDKINRQERVLPQGLLSISSAKKIYSIVIFVSLVFSAIVSLQYLIIIIALNILLLLYSTHLKKIILLSNFTVALATAFPLVLGGMTVNNIEGGLIPAGFAFFSNFIREIIKDIEDIKGDSQKAVKTFPQKFGISKSIYFAVVLIFLLMILTLFPFLLRIYSAEYFLIIMVIVNPIFVYTLKLLFGNLDLKTFRKISSLIKLNMILGLIAILVGV